MASLNIAIIGGTGGLGRALSNYYADKGDSITVYGRTFRDADVKNISFVKADLSLMSNVKALVQTNSFDITKYDMVIFTAGIFAATKREETSEGLERDLASSYINRLVMLEESIPNVKADQSKVFQKPRIFIMAYPGNNQLGTPEDLNQEKGYGVMKAHMNTVAGNEAIVTHFADQPNFNIYGLNPGLVKTNIRDNLFGTGLFSSFMEFFIGWMNKTPEQYANTIGPLLKDIKLEGKSGSFYNHKAEQIPASKGFTKTYAAEFVKKSYELLKKKGLY